jgi:hypothetical protein
MPYAYETLCAFVKIDSLKPHLNRESNKGRSHFSLFSFCSWYFFVKVMLESKHQRMRDHGSDANHVQTWYSLDRVLMKLKGPPNNVLITVKFR